MAIPFGPQSHPVSMDPFNTIVRVQWGGGIHVFINMTSNKGSGWGMALEANGKRFPPRDPAAEAAAQAALAAAEAELAKVIAAAQAGEGEAAHAELVYRNMQADFIAEYGDAGVWTPISVPDQAPAGSTPQQIQIWNQQIYDNYAIDQANYEERKAEVAAAQAALDAARSAANDSDATVETLQKAVDQARDAVRDKQSSVTDAIAKTSLSLSGATPGDITKAFGEGGMVLTQGGGEGDEGYMAFWAINVDKVLAQAPGAETIKLEFYKSREKARTGKAWVNNAKLVKMVYRYAGWEWWEAGADAAVADRLHWTLSPPSWTTLNPLNWYNAMVHKENPQATAEITGPRGGPPGPATLAEINAAGANASYPWPVPDPMMDRWDLIETVYEGKEGEYEIPYSGTGGGVVLQSDTYTSFGPPAVSKKATVSVSGDAANGATIGSDGDALGGGGSVGGGPDDSGLMVTITIPTSAG